MKNLLIILIIVVMTFRITSQTIDLTFFLGVLLGYYYHKSIK